MRFFAKCYASLIVAHDKCWSFLYVYHICQKLPKPNRFFRAMVSGRVFCLHRRQCNGWLILVFSQNDSKVNKNHVSCCGPAFDMNWLTILTTNVISALVAIIAYMRAPTRRCMEHLPISFIHIQVLHLKVLTVSNLYQLEFDRFIFFRVEMLKDLIGVTLLIYDDGTGFSIPQILL